MPVTEEKILLTQEGWRKLHEELAALRKQRGLELSEHMETGHTGDWLESAAQYVNSNMATLSRRITQIEEVLHRSVPVGPADREPGVVGVGSKVVVQWEDGEREDFILVGPPEVDTSAGKISYEAPVGRALMGNRAGMWVDVETPGGSCRLQIITVV
ncbi:MAG: GreA/GreB family elongation factor [Chloroflexota bacterium]|jgi:transcription elongation factor GreA